MEKFYLISIGAILGANARYWISDRIAQYFGDGFPIGTLIVNLSGSFLLGLFLTLTTEKLFIDPKYRLIIAVGFLGAYTTFSTYTFESINLIIRGQSFLGMVNLIGSTVLGIVAVGLGVFLGKII